MAIFLVIPYTQVLDLYDRNKKYSKMLKYFKIWLYFLVIPYTMVLDLHVKIRDICTCARVQTLQLDFEHAPQLLRSKISIHFFLLVNLLRKITEQVIILHLSRDHGAAKITEQQRSRSLTVHGAAKITEQYSSRSSKYQGAGRNKKYSQILKFLKFSYIFWSSHIPRY